MYQIYRDAYQKRFRHLAIIIYIYIYSINDGQTAEMFLICISIYLKGRRKIYWRIGK